MFRRTPKSWSPRIVVSITVSTLIVLAAATISARAWLIRSSMAGDDSTKQQTPTVPTAFHIRSPLEVELISVHPYGFEPKEITRPKGRFLLEVDDHSGLKSIAPRLTRVTGPKLRDFDMKREEPAWSEEMDLGPGRYVLSEANHPGWTCYINITP